ncbi:hypothetical protein BH18ACT1_BH18ACT1_10690 [soil metagenome]
MGIGLLLALFLVPQLLQGDGGRELTYADFLQQVRSSQVERIVVNTESHVISGETVDGDEFRVSGPTEVPEQDQQLFRENDVEYDFETPQPNFFTALIPFLLPVALLIGFFIWMQRRASGQMGSIMQIGRSRAKTYSTERPGTTFADVAGYEGVKREIT